MGLRINNSNITQMKINGSNIKLVKINNSIIFQLEDAVITLTFTEKIIKAVSNKSDSYDFYYANDDGIINDYDKIVSFNLTANVTSSYTYLNSFNIAPYEATKIVVCKSGTNNILSSSTLPSQFKFDNSTYGNKLYSFGALSDVHIDGDGTDEASASSDFARALKFFNSNASLVCISGDLCNENGYSELSLFKDLVDANATIPVYASRGNHDCRYSISDFETYTGGSLYFEQTYQNDKFIFLGMNAENYGNSCFTTEELDWLETKLESYKNQRVFLFFHVFMPNTCGNINNLYPWSGLNTSSSIVSRFVTMMTNYKNVIYFSGHSHLEFACQRFGPNANIFSKGSTCHRVHIPSCAKPRKNDTGTSSSNTYQYDAGSQGYLVDVYENCIILKGRDFVKGKYLPIANYLLDTTIINMEQSTNLFKTSAILYSSTGSQYASGKDRGGVVYTYETASENVTLNGTPTYSNTQGFKVTEPLIAGKTYKLYTELVSGSVDLGTKNHSLLLEIKSIYNGENLCSCYTDSTDTSTMPESRTYTPTSDLNEWYLMISHRSSEVVYSNYTIAIHVEEV